MNKGDYEQALLHYQRCLTIQERVKGKDAIDCAIDSQQHRFSLLEQRRLRTGTAALPKMLDNPRKSQRQGRHRLRHDSQQHRFSLLNKGDYEQALLHYQRCLTIQERVKGKDAIDCASTLNNIGLVYKEQRRLRTGTAALPKMLDNPRKSQRQGRHRLRHDSQQHRFSLQRQRRLRTGTAALPKMLDNPRKSQRQGRHRLRHDSQQHRFSLLEQRRLRTGTAALPKMLDNPRKSQRQGRHRLRIDSQQHRKCLQNKGDYEQALLHYQRCLTIQERVKGKDAIDCAMTLNNIGSVY
jgi:tetratricopeptide (TPR) repeat protein